MTLEQYQKEAQRTCPSLGSLSKDKLHMILGLITEIGETLDVFKKELAYKKQIDMVNLGEELCGDISWYLVNLCRLNNIEIKDNWGLELSSKNNKFLGESNEIIAKGIIDLLDDIMFIYKDDANTYFKCFQNIYYLSQALGLNYFEYLDRNITKLKIRFPEKFTEENALNRNLEAEREALEK